MACIITYTQFRALLGIESDDNWLGGVDCTHSTPAYRIVGNKEVRAVPLGYIVDRDSNDFIRPLKHDPLYREGDLSTAEWTELRPYCDDPDEALLIFPATHEAVCAFLRQADLGWLVDDAAWAAFGFTGEPNQLDVLPGSDTIPGEAGLEPFRFNAQREHSEYTEMMRLLAKRLHGKLGRNARGREAWTALIENPPSGFGIITAPDTVEIHGEPPLGKREFLRRWQRWTKPH